MVAGIDLNSDLGEGYGAWRMGDDEALLDIVTSANVACGAHAGDPETMREVCARAVAGGVSIGAHVSYPDRDGFGRRFVAMTSAELTASVMYQVGALSAFARAAGGEVAYVKLHGALYNTVVDQHDHAAAVVDALDELGGCWPILGLADSELLRLAEERGHRPIAEAFADRQYDRTGRLVSRRHPGAVLHDPAAIAERAVRIVRTGRLESATGELIEVRAESLCVHGDTPGAVEIAARVRDALHDAGIFLRPFVAA